MPDFGMFVNEGLENLGARRVVHDDDLNTLFDKPVVTPGEVFGLANDHGSNIELIDETRAVPTR